VTLLKSTKLCDRQEAFQRAHTSISTPPTPWGSGVEIRIPETHSESGGEESFFFDEDGQLVGTVFAFPRGLHLAKYPILSQTLSGLRPQYRFFISAPQVRVNREMETGILYKTGDETSTTQYVTLQDEDDRFLLLASVSIDTYEPLLSPLREEFRNHIGKIRTAPVPKSSKRGGKEAKESFATLQQFARGETALLGYCQARNFPIAAAAYKKAIESGFTDETWLAEAHHKLGLVYQEQGELEQAEAAIQQALAIRPHTPEFLNNLGTIYLTQGKRDQALRLFEKAVSLRPNYAVARYNLGELYEATNPKRAISEYETYLALVEGIPEEANRAMQVQARLKRLVK
jgi:tetratricopeptide (TPR) repeat protein